METDDCMISFLEDGYLVKQIKNPDPDEQFLLVLDATACAIAESIDLPINRVKIIPPHVSFPGKGHPELPATLHTRVPGTSIPESDLEVRIHQRVQKAGRPNPWPLPPEREGLNPKVIEHMARHPDLPGIAALDTFIGNGDRSQPNLFYDPGTDRYFGIDLAASFCSELGAAACRQIERSREFSAPEREALKNYADTLKRLVCLWPPEAIEQLLLENAREAGLEGVERIHFHQKIIRSNYASAVELVRLISAL